MSLLHEVAANGDVERLDDLLEQPRIDKNEKDDDWEGRTPLFWSVIEGHHKCVKKLLEAGANPTLRNHEDKTPAHYAAENGRCDILKSIIEYGCDLTVKDRYGDTTLDYALMYGNLECAALICQTLRGEFRRKVEPNYWSEVLPPKLLLRPDLRRKQTLISLLSGVKSAQNQDHDASSGRVTPSRRKKKQLGKQLTQKTIAKLH